MMFALLVQLLVVHTVAQNSTRIKKKVKIGIAAAEQTMRTSIAWSVCGGAVGLALDKSKQDFDLKDFEFSINVVYTECDLVKAVGAGIEFMMRQQVDVMIGPPCPEAGLMMAHLSNVYQTPWMGWGFVIDPQFALADKFPLVTTLTPTSQTIGVVAVRVLAEFNWDIVSVLYTTSVVRFCVDMVDSFVDAASDPSSAFSTRIAMVRTIDMQDNEGLTQILQQVRQRSRVVVLCLDSAKDRRLFLARVAQLGMTTEEYVYVLLAMRSQAFGQAGAGQATLKSGLTPFWEDTVNNNADGLDAAAKSAAKRMVVIDVNADIGNQSYLSQFQDNIMKRVREPPLSCSTKECLTNDNETMGSFSRQLHDTFYAFCIGLSRVPDGYHDAINLTTAITSNFSGLTGEVMMTANNTRVADFMLYYLDASFQQQVYMQLIYRDGNMNVTSFSSSPESTIWATRGGARPLSTPRCGFSGQSCPKGFWELYTVYVAVGGAIVALLIITIIAFTVHIIRERRLAKQRLMDEWRLPYHRITIPSKEMEKKSYRSLQSGPSTITSTSAFDSPESIFTVALLDSDAVLITKHPPTLLPSSALDNCLKLRKLDHDNVNNFFGFSFDGLDYVVVWKMCPRGSLQAVIARSSMSTDSFFVQCLIRDVAEGLNYIHKSFLSSHGHLSSASCLVTESFQVKLCDYGLPELTRSSEITLKLWWAPELLNSSLNGGTKSADVYAFAIVASEIMARQPAWNLYGDNNNVEDLIRAIKHGGSSPLRPTIPPDVDISSEVLSLVRSCWRENATNRPSMDFVCEQLREILSSSSQKNLMDHVFSIMEEYTFTLEQEVGDRTKELTDEKKKADLLLSRMLPKEVAERLKLGQSVEPEGFDSVTVFFSDVVKFTALAAKCSPFQVVSLLNELYSSFDAIIEEHGAYKVESIGDGYLCVSGLPVRNGHQHVREIAQMSISFMAYVNGFRVVPFPRERIQLRIGLNSGPCVAGVVGLSMPRYCLFGDTVNTASRMESNGKPGRIHVSESSFVMLQKHFPNEYDVESRGEVIIKGKGVMETYWLNCRHTSRSPPHTPEERRAIRQDTDPNQQETTRVNDTNSPEHMKEPLYRQYKQGVEQ